MNHLSEEELILHYYGEGGETLATEQHLDECDACRALYGSLQRVLNVVDSLPVPERGPEYGTEVWKRLEPSVSKGWWSRWIWRGLRLPRPLRLAGAAAALSLLLAAAFLAGRFYPQPKSGRPAQVAAADPQAGERVLLLAVGDYLERSQMVLIELANAHPQGRLDISAEKERAADLVSESRLYRQTASRTGDGAVGGMLDELDRVLLEISHAPSKVSPGELEALRQRFEAEGILFKIRVLGSNVRNQEEAGQPQARQKL